MINSSPFTKCLFIVVIDIFISNSPFFIQILTLGMIPLMSFFEHGGGLFSLGCMEFPTFEHDFDGTLKDTQVRQKMQMK